MSENQVVVGSSSSEIKNRTQLVESLKSCPIPDAEILQNIGIFINRQNLSRILYIHELYKKVLPVCGVVMEFGVRWGQNMALYENLRGIYEPYNHSRKIIGFDSFEGFPCVDEKDGKQAHIQPGAYGVTQQYEEYLNGVMQYHESESPIAHKKKYELVRGDATQTIHEYLARHPETIVAFAYFDFDIYTPTKACLQAILPHLTRGSVLAFDEVNDPNFPGETLALQEVLGSQNVQLQRSQYSPMGSYLIYDK